MKRFSLDVSLYLLNGAILLTHEIDSAYWKEWELFGMGGGIQLFLAINFVMVLVVLIGLQHLAAGKRAGHGFALLLAAAGIYAFSVHTWYLHCGYPQFDTLASRILLWAALIVSPVQAYVAVRGLRR
jgi:hypothetical protein